MSIYFNLYVISSIKSLFYYPVSGIILALDDNGISEQIVSVILIAISLLKKARQGSKDSVVGLYILFLETGKRNL